MMAGGDAVGHDQHRHLVLLPAVAGDGAAKAEDFVIGMGGDYEDLFGHGVVLG